MKRNKFSLSHWKLATMDMGKLIPLTWYEALPGDTIQQATMLLVRVSPLLSPVMHPVIVKIHHWFVPNRLIWEDWEEFITGGPDGVSVPVHPYRAVATATEGDIWDYFGVRPGSYSPSLELNALPLRAYQRIWNENYRDQDLSNEATIDLTDGQDTTTYGQIQNVCWEKDYFTTARPWEQKGSTVTIPYSGEADVKTDSSSRITGAHPVLKMRAASGTVIPANRVLNAEATSGNVYQSTTAAGTKADEVYPYNLYADLSSGAGIPINDLRLALAIQKFQERMGRSGSRYSEYLRFLGVKSSDARLQQPEYLGGGRQIISFSEVLSTDGSNTGDMKGHGIAAMRTNRYRRFFEEHGIVMTLMSVVPKAMYADALDRSFLRQTKEDYFQRELQHIGEQEITNQEVYPAHTTPGDIFGYQGRYDEYRHKLSGISGEFRSTLDHWHYARIFGSDPSLNETFVKATPTKRVNASDSTDCLYVMANHSIQARRMISPRAIPLL